MTLSMPNALFQFYGFQFTWHAIPIMAVSLLILAIGLMILFETKRTVGNIAFVLFCFSSTLWLFTMGFVYSSPNPETALRIYKTLTFFGVINLTPNLYLFAACASGLMQRQLKWVILTYITTYSIYFLSLTTDKFITAPHLYYWGLYPHYEPLNYLFLLTFAIVFFANQAHLKLAFEREESAIKKKQIRLIKLSLLFGLTAFIDFAAKIWMVNIYPTGFISMFILICLLAYSIIRYKAFDIETVIHKTILWTASFLLIIIPVFLAYRLSFPYIKESSALQMIFGVTSFFIFAFYLRVIQPKIDHVFQRRKANLEEISSQFIGDLVHLKGVDNLIRLIETTITNALYPRWVDIFVYDERQGGYQAANRSTTANRPSRFLKDDAFLKWLNQNDKIVYREFFEIDPEYADIKDVAARYFESTQAVVAVPLVLNERLLGVINLEKKANLKRYNAVDFQFLTTLKNQAAIAISNSLIYQNIESQVKARTAELVEVQKQLIQAEKLATVGTLSGGVAHEINNPLTAILTNVQMLLAFSDDEGAKMDKESLQLIEEATQRCRTIVQKLMTYAKKPLESEQVSVTDLLDVLKKTIAFISYQLEQDSIKIVVDVKDDSYCVLGNHNELEQVLTNLILNARDAILAANKKGNIYITLSKSNHHVTVKVKDEGTGISKEVIAKIFDPFFTTKDVGKGLGLGLSICQSIVAKYKGTITVDSKPGKGSVFEIKFSEYAQKKATVKV